VDEKQEADKLSEKSQRVCHRMLTLSTDTYESLSEGIYTYIFVISY